MNSRKPRGFIENLRISGVETGVSIKDTDFDARNISFDNVETPWDIQGGSGSITGSRITNDPKISLRRGTINKSRVGWRRPNGPPLPAFCPKCKAVFPSRNYNIGSSEFWGFDNDETCPNCRYEHAKVADGLFDLSKETVAIIIAPEFSHAMLSQAAQIAASIVSGEISVTSAAEKIGFISPELASLFKKIGTFGAGAVVFISLVIQYIDHKINIEQLRYAKESVEIQRDQYLSEFLSMKDNYKQCFVIEKNEINQCKYDLSCGKKTDRKLVSESLASSRLPKPKPKSKHK